MGTGRQSQGKLWLALTVASIGAAATFFYWRRHSKRRSKDHNGPDDNTSASTAELEEHETTGTASPSVAKSSVDAATSTADAATIFEAFRDASARMRQRPSESLSNGEKLLLYGLYKQATEGDAGPFSFRNASWNLLEAQAKHHAWSQFKTMPPETAMLHYLKAVQDIETNENRPDPDDDEEPVGMGNAVSMPVREEGYEDNEKDDEKDPRAMAGKRLLRAAGSNDVKTMELVLESGQVSADFEDETGQTALHLAADKGSQSCLESLLKHGANPSSADQDGISVLQAAVIAGKVGAVKVLLDHGADPDQADNDGDTPRSCAADDGSLEMKQLFGLN